MTVTASGYCPGQLGQCSNALNVSTTAFILSADMLHLCVLTVPSICRQVIFDVVPVFHRRVDTCLTNLGLPRLPLGRALFK